MTTIGINLLVYMQELNNGTVQSALLPTSAANTSRMMRNSTASVRRPKPTGWTCSTRCRNP